MDQRPNHGPFVVLPSWITRWTEEIVTVPELFEGRTNTPPAIKPTSTITTMAAAMTAIVIPLRRDRRLRGDIVRLPSGEPRRFYRDGPTPYVLEGARE